VKSKKISTKIEKSDRLLTRILNIDPVSFAAMLYQDKPSAPRHQYSSKVEWIKHKCNLQVIDAHLKEYVAIIFSSSPSKLKSHHPIPCTWPPKWFGCSKIKPPMLSTMREESLKTIECHSTLHQEAKSEENHAVYSCGNKSEGQLGYRLLLIIITKPFLY